MSYYHVGAPGPPMYPAAGPGPSGAVYYAAAGPQVPSHPNHYSMIQPPPQYAGVGYANGAVDYTQHAQPHAHAYAHGNEHGSHERRKRPHSHHRRQQPSPPGESKSNYKRKSTGYIPDKSSTNSSSIGGGGGLSGRVDSIMAELRKSEERVQKLQTELDQARSNEKEQKEQFEKIEGTNREMRELLGTLEGAVTEYKTRNEALVTQSEKHKEEMTSKNTELQTARDQNDFLYKRNQTLLAKCEDQHAQVTQLKEARDSGLEESKKKISDLERQLRESSDALKHKETEMNQVKTRVNKLEKDNGGLTHQLAVLERQARMSQGSDRLLRDIEMLRRKNEDVWRSKANQLDTIHRACATIRRMQNDTHAQMGLIRSQNDQLTRDLERKNKRIKELESCSTGDKAQQQATSGAASRR